jgi:hypothetical protein
MINKPLKLVMIRRGASKVFNVRSENLITFVRKKILIGTDELSGDGNKWIRVDQHYQLRKYFISNEEGLINLTQATKSDEPEKIAPPPDFKDDLREMASLLKDING